MEYYKFRSKLMRRIRDHLAEREVHLQAGNTPPPFSKFQEKLMVETGATEKMIKSMVEQLTNGATVQDGEIVAKNEE